MGSRVTAGSCVTGKVGVEETAWGGDERDGGSKWSRGRVVAEPKCQNVGPAVLKYEEQRIGEIQHEARSRCSASSEWPW
jgi:hypothetical protein